jgi:hypothetical protein
MPQLFGSVIVLTHVAPQTVSPVVHSHWPLTHDPPAGHTVPHAPQLLGSFDTLVHPEGHRRSPVGQVHLPLTHDSPAGQVPQLSIPPQPSEMLSQLTPCAAHVVGVQQTFDGLHTWPAGHVPQMSFPPQPSSIVPQFLPCCAQVFGVHIVVVVVVVVGVVVVVEATTGAQMNFETPGCTTRVPN